MYVLIVDDSLTMRRVIVESLRPLLAGKAAIVEATTGEEALDILCQRPGARLVLLDWYLPGMSGLDVIMAAQADSELAEIPVVMVTAERKKENVIAALRTGAKNYIVKPFTQAVFRRKVGPFLDISEQKEPERPAGSLFGNLSQTSPMEVVQLISMTRKTGVLTFESPGGVYSLYFKEGQIDHAEGMGKSGEEAIGAAGDIEGGTFSFRTELPSHPTTVRRSTDMILLRSLGKATSK